MGKINLKVGQEFTFTKTVTETDVYLFAGITGDFCMHHINEEYMKNSPFKTRIAHGVLSLGLSSTTAGMAVIASGQTCISYGYDKIRFLRPVVLEDTVTAVYTIAETNEETGMVTADIKCVNQRGELLLVGKHLLKIMFD